MAKPQKVIFTDRVLDFAFEARTSRGKMSHHKVYYLHITNHEGKTGTGEVAPLPGLSLDFSSITPFTLMVLGQKIKQEPLPTSVDEAFATAARIAKGFPSARIAIETAYLDLILGGNKLIFNNKFSSGLAHIPINGLIWMNEAKQMIDEGTRKFKLGFNCLKLKVGSLQWKKELEVLKSLRSLAPPSQLTIRVDANGAFTNDNIWLVLDQLERLQIHSIEQPVHPKNIKLLDELSHFSPVPIALDEQLIGAQPYISFLDQFIPHYFVLKPTLLGGFANTLDWIKLAETAGVGWWITSALESNIGLNAISQFTYSNMMPNFEQGLGTGQLYKNNIASPLTLGPGILYYDTSKSFETESW